MEATVADRNETCPTCRANDRDWRGVVPAPSDIPGVQLGTTRCFDPWHDAAPAPREDICKGCSTYAWCSVTGACLAESNPHDKGDRDRVVSTLSMLDPSPPSSPPTAAEAVARYEAMRDENATLRRLLFRAVEILEDEGFTVFPDEVRSTIAALRGTTDDKKGG